MTVLITGGSGFLGSRIKFFANKENYNVLAPRSKLLNLLSQDSVDSFLNTFKDKNIEHIIHSAVFYGGIGTNIKYPADLILKNNIMTSSIFKLAKGLNIKKFISVGSACAWPGHIEGDLLERDVFNGRPHDSIEAYGFNKRVHLVFGKAFYKQHGIQFNQLALANLYGENDVYTEERSHVISSFIKKVVDAKKNNTQVEAWGTGTPIRQFLHVDDAAKIIVKSIKFEHDLDPINIYGESVSIKELFEIICRIVGFDEKKVYWNINVTDGVKRKVLAVGKLKKLLPDYKFINLENGLKKTIDWYINNQSFADCRK